MITSILVPGVLFIIGIAAILISGGSTMPMMVGDAMVALAGLSFVKFSK